MKKVKLKKLLGSDENLNLLRGLGVRLNSSFRILDESDKEIFTFGEPPYGNHFTNINLEDEIYAKVEHHQSEDLIPQSIDNLIQKEQSLKNILNETLEKYKEINFIYNFSERISSCLEIEQIGEVVVDEAMKLFHSDSVSLFLHQEGEKYFKILSSSNKDIQTISKIGPGLGIAGFVFLSGISEIIEDISIDPRYTTGNSNPTSMMCVPLKTSNQTLGVITVSTKGKHTYTSGDLKLLTSLGLEAAVSLQNTFLQENKIKEEMIKNNLGRFVSPQVLDTILNAKGELSLSSEKRKVSLLFSDIRNFTGFCEILSPEEIVSYLNEYFTEMVNVIFSHQGTIDKFVGDAIFALFGAPGPIDNSEKKSVESAIEMQIALRNMKNIWVRKNFTMGIGINVGDVVVGNIGSMKHMDYTAIGDEVNVAARLQSIAKSYQILVSKSIYEATKSDFHYRDLGHVQVKGKKNEIEIFEVVY
jgi:adenylate cyclase